MGLDKKIRTITEILIQADECKSVVDINYLSQEIMGNKKEYSLVELNFAKEHIKMLTDRIIGI